MLAEERFREIQKYVEIHGTVTVQELTDLLNTSESTIRIIFIKAGWYGL